MRSAPVEAPGPEDIEIPEPDLDPELNWDYSEVDWAENSQDEWALMQQQLSSTRVSVSDPEPHDTNPAAWGAPPVPDVDFDREWT